MLISVVVLLFTTVASSAVSQNHSFDKDRFDRNRFFRARLSGFQENPTLSSPGKGEFVAKVSSNEISYRLVYWDLPTKVTQAHLHLGAKAVNGGIAAFLCGPQPQAGNKPECTSPSGVVTGTIVASDIIGPNGQGIAPGEFAEVVRALRNEVIYANVHTEQFPAGEIRGQVLSDDDE